MDALDQLAGPAHDLLSRVDDVLARAGVPPDHPLGPLLRRLRALPGAAVSAVAALRPGPLAAAGSALRALSGQYAQPAVSAPDWRGPAAEAFRARWAALGAYVEQGLAHRLAETAAYAEEVAGWVTRTRLATARALATVMTSAEAVALATGVEPVEAASAAAEIARRVLGTVADAYAEADLLLQAWSGRLAELPFPLPAAAPPTSGVLDVPL
ncbi:MAG: hypothetical protein IRZ05_15460 [Micromonosporaceae bacterium]|jgi:hypothetical protein|nr:hypothetical protein [Micromonosporaceae bacterium]